MKLFFRRLVAVSEKDFQYYSINEQGEALQVKLGVLVTTSLSTVCRAEEADVSKFYSEC